MITFDGRLPYGHCTYIRSRLCMIYVTPNDLKLNNIGKYFIQFCLYRSIQIFSHRVIELMVCQNMEFHLIQIVVDIPPYFVCLWFGQFVSSLVRIEYGLWFIFVQNIFFVKKSHNLSRDSYLELVFSLLCNCYKNQNQTDKFDRLQFKIKSKWFLSKISQFLGGKSNLSTQ